MCRLFGLHAGRNVVTATFWLLDAPDNLAAQSRRNPDGTGVGVFGAGGEPQIDKQPMAAWHDNEFACEAKELTGTTFLAHVRYATTGKLDVVNTHPFLQDGRIFAHNGVVEGLDQLDERLESLGALELVKGQTDSERVFALITACIRARGGDVSAGVTDAIGWVADNLPLYSVNVLLCTATEFWALRYPDSHDLYVLDRRGAVGAFELRTDRIRARSGHLSEAAVGGVRHRADGRQPGVAAARRGRAGARRRRPEHHPPTRLPGPAAPPAAPPLNLSGKPGSPRMG